jgi:hypothetical protein
MHWLLSSETKEERGHGNLGSHTGSPTVFILDHCGFWQMFSINVDPFSLNLVRSAPSFSGKWSGNPDVFGPGDLCSRAATARLAACASYRDPWMNSVCLEDQAKAILRQ